MTMGLYMGCPIVSKVSEHNLVGGFNPSEKYDFVSWDDEIPN